jgi:RiboL-PSP-HEPN
MTTHSAKSLFDKNIGSAQECLDLFDGLSKLKVTVNLDWLLRASIVFAVSALDTYFHDKVRYKVGHFTLNDLPPQLAAFTVPIRELVNWDDATRKGNVLRNWVTEHLSVRPLQSPTAIADALKLAGYESLWDRIEPNKTHKQALLDKFNSLIKRRNQISHEGDREQSRRSGKKLRPISRGAAEVSIKFVQDLVAKVETAFPK